MAGKSFDASDPKQVEDQAKASKLREQQRRVVLATLLANADGREWLGQLLRDTKVFEERIAVSGGVYEQGFLNGQREVGLSILRMLAKSAPAHFATLLQEHDI